MYKLSDLVVLCFSGFCWDMEYSDRFGYNILLAYIMAVVTIVLTIYSIVRLCKEITNINDEKDNN